MSHRDPTKRSYNTFAEIGGWCIVVAMCFLAAYIAVLNAIEVTLSWLR